MNIKNLFSQNSNLDTYLKIGVVLGFLLIAVAVFIYVIRGSTTPKTNYQYCIERCKNLGTPPVSGKCENNAHLGKREKTVGEYKKGDPWCIMNEGACFNICKDQ